MGESVEEVACERKNNKFMFVVAAALAAAGVDEADASEGLGTFGLQAGFSPGAERTDEGYLRTSKIGRASCRERV